MSVTQPSGFRASGVTAGLKPSGKPDLALIVRDTPVGPGVGSACVFTRSVVVGAPVIVGRQQRDAILHDRQPPVSAVLINAGNSNSATGQQGVHDALACASSLAEQLHCEARTVLPVSTGVIGRPLAVGKIQAVIPSLVSTLSRGEAADVASAAAIMTTDLVPKRGAASVQIGGRTIKLGAMAKGSGMVCPRLDSASRPPTPTATMLAFFTTDAPIASADLQTLLESCCRHSFERISVDNHPSCSDTIVALSSGAAGGAVLKPGTRDFDAFADALRGICTDLATQVVTDGEGATRVFRVTVAGASTEADAEAMAREVVNSPLVKCAIHGRDPNWGRIVTAAGNAGIPFDPLQASLLIGPVEVYKAGVPVVPALTDPRLVQAMGGKHVEVKLTVGPGPASAWMLGCDLSKDYVSINADYTT